MGSIRIFSPALKLLGEIDDYESLIFIRRWNSPGEFTLVINRHKKYADQLQKRNIIMIDNNPDKIAIIKHREIKLDEKGKLSESWTIQGYTLDGLTYQRIILPPAGEAYDSITDTAEAIMKHYMDTCFVNPVKTNRKLDLLAVNPNLDRGQTLSWQARFSDLNKELEDISILTGLGWNVTLDIAQKKMLFDVYEGKNLTVNQSLHPPVIFSPDYDSIKEQHYIDSDLSYKNTAYVGGQGEGGDRAIIEVQSEEVSGMDLYEVFVDARDLTDESGLITRGEQKLAELHPNLFLEAKILEKSPFEYQKDYDLGDIVTIQHKSWNVTMDARITEVQETYESGGFTLEATFGNSIPDLITVIKRDLSQVNAEVRK